MTSRTALAAALTKAIGANEEQQEVKVWLDTGLPTLNKIISGRYTGGFPGARIVELFGPPSSGKTAIATNVMAACQKIGGVAVFMDHERSFDVTYAKELGLDDGEGSWIYKQPETFEQSIDMAVEIGRVIRDGNYISPETPIVVVFDSLAAMVPKSKFDKKMADFNMNDTTALARATSASFPALAQFALKYNILFLFLNQARTKIGVIYGDPTTTPGGNAPEFYASVRIKLGASMVKKDDKVVGQKVGAETIKNKCILPRKKVTWEFQFLDDGRGKFDAVGATVDHLCELGILEVGGPRVKWTDGKNYFKSQLIDKIEKDGLKDELFALLPKDE